MGQQGHASQIKISVKEVLLPFCICENKDTDQLRGDCEADQRLCFCCIDSIIPQLFKYKIPSL